jgi:hypothetical protein
VHLIKKFFAKQQQMCRNMTLFGKKAGFEPGRNRAGTTEHVSQVASWGGKIVGPAHFTHFSCFCKMKIYCHLFGARDL